MLEGGLVLGYKVNKLVGFFSLKIGKEKLVPIKMLRKTGEIRDIASRKSPNTG